MTKTDTKKRLRIYIIAAVILVIIAGAAAFVWYRFGSVKVSCMLDDGSVTETRLSRGDSFVFPETADYDGYTFVYWMDAKGARYSGESVELYVSTSFSPVYTVALETVEHNPYLFPDENGFYRPYDKLTRGEAARMIYALLAQPVEATGNYIDVDKNADYAQATAALWQLKVTGESKFHPDEIITRGELLSLLCSFYRETEQDYAFADADSDSYYYRELCTAAELGWINSGEDVNALPDEELTKIDAVRLINNILNREKAGKVSAKLLGAVPDASPQLSDYAELLEAALGHEYEIVDGVERWTKNDEFTRHASGFVTIGTHLYYFDRTGTIARNTDVGTMHFDEYGRYTLKVYDAYRPRSAQVKLYDIVQNNKFIANPYTGGSWHQRGRAIDMSLIDNATGLELEMPTPMHTFDDSAARYSRDSWTEEARKNVDYMTSVMESVGFGIIQTEWWHFENNSGPGSYLPDEIDFTSLTYKPVSEYQGS